MAISGTVVEKFTDRNHEGLHIVLELSDKGHIYFGNRFDVEMKWLNGDIGKALKFFRNIMTITTRDEWKSEFEQFRAAL